MKSLVLRGALACLAALAMTALASLASAQDYCPHCHGWHGHGHHGAFLHGRGWHGYGIEGGDEYGNGPRVHSHALIGAAGANFGDCVHRYYGAHDLFGQYYVGNNCGGFGAAMYVSPLPVPPHVGHTYITYQPLMPHEFLYRHHHTYHRYYNGGMGLTRAKVLYW